MNYDLIVVGTGFASSFFLSAYLTRAPRSARVLVLERGARESRAWQLQERRVSRVPHDSTFVRTGRPDKTWQFTVGFGGGSNCWWACTPRLMPNDFRLASAYGVGDDWPVGYDELEPYYERVESMMAVSGDPEHAPYPRRRPLPQPPHAMSAPDRLLASAYPAQHLPQPTARARVATGRRPACCGSGVCGLCPIDAKFTIENTLSDIYDDPRVTLRLECEARSLEVRDQRVDAVRSSGSSGEEVFRGGLVVLGAGALFNAAMLLRSQVSHPLLGRRLFEQTSVSADIDLHGLDNFQGSSVISANGYMLYDGPHRARHAACLIESWNRPDQLRWEPGRERQLLHLKLILEDLPDERNYVHLGTDGRPVLHFEDYSAYAYRGAQAVADRLPDVLAPLPVESIRFNPELSSTEGHMLGTVVMGDDPETSVVDRWMVHHEIRNLAVIGGSAFPTGGPSNPTLTISAMAMRSAEHLLS